VVQTFLLSAVMDAKLTGGDWLKGKMELVVLGPERAECNEAERRVGDPGLNGK